jgi:GNAT superfamily N-acetyltransferase
VEACVTGLHYSTANADDAPALVHLHLDVAHDLTARYGEGHWSRLPTEKGVLRRIADSRVIVARDAGGRMAGTLELVTRKPWAIDRAYFTAVKRPLYLLNMAVEVSLQRRGVGRLLLGEAARVARAWPAQSICLDAYDAAAGAGEFYARCGYQERGRKVYRGVPLVYYEWLIQAPTD